MALSSVKENKFGVIAGVALIACVALIAFNFWYRDCVGVPIDQERVQLEKKNCENTGYAGVEAKYSGPVCTKGKWDYTGDGFEKNTKNSVCPTGVKMLPSQGKQLYHPH